MDFGEILSWVLLGLPAFIIAGTVHEYMHAWTARKLGDYTATMMGRLSLNPLVHLDPFGFLFMILFRFGWMKPVPVNEYNFQKPVRDMALTAAAGPASNLVMAIFGALIFRVVDGVFGIDDISTLSLIGTFLITFVWVNIALMLFNLIPIPPLDGYRIVRSFLPGNARYYWESAEKYSFLFLLLLFIPFSPLSQFTGVLLTSGVTYIVELLL